MWSEIVRWVNWNCKLSEMKLCMLSEVKLYTGWSETVHWVNWSSVRLVKWNSLCWVNWNSANCVNWNSANSVNLSYVLPLKFSIPLLFTTDVLTCALTTGYLPQHLALCTLFLSWRWPVSESKRLPFTADFTYYFSYCTFLEINKSLRFEIDFTCMNFGELLFGLNFDPLKNELRKIVKINKLIVQTKNCIYFNEICLKGGLRPKFVIYNIYIAVTISQITYLSLDPQK